MPKPHPKEFRDDVIAIARKGEASIGQIAKDFGISESCLRNWLAKAVELASALDRWGRAPEPVQVTCRKERADNTPLVTVTPDVKSTTITYGTASGQQDGWLIYGCVPE